MTEKNLEVNNHEWNASTRTEEAAVTIVNESIKHKTLGKVKVDKIETEPNKRTDLYAEKWLQYMNDKDN